DVKKSVKSDALTPLRRWTAIFDASVDKLGLLTSSEVAAILDAYLPLQELTPKIRLFELRVPPEHRRVEYGEAPPEGYAFVAHYDVQALSEIHANYGPAFDRAIKLLGDNVR